MLNRKKNNRVSNEVNAGSMADIAFLLLIFFLVTTTIDIDKGITVKLPPWSNEEVDPTKLNKRNVFSVLVNADDQLLVRGELTEIGQLRERAKEFIVNPTKREDLAEKPTKAIISLKNDRGTSYGTYIQVYNELKAAYNELWTEKLRTKSGYTKESVFNDDLPIAIRREIRSEIPFVLSEAEPTNFGEE